MNVQDMYRSVCLLWWYGVAAGVGDCTSAFLQANLVLVIIGEDKGNLRSGMQNR